MKSYRTCSLCAFVFCMAALAFLPRVCGAPPQQVPPSELKMDATCFPAIDRWIKELMAADNIPGAIVAVGRGDRLALLRKWGDRQRNPVPEPLTWDTLYDLASVGKVVGLAPCIWMLVDQGKIRPEDPVCKYLPEFTGNGKERIAIADFLTHTSGIRDGYSWDGTPDDIWRAICGTTCKANPGERFEYSCLGCLILGKMIERVTGETYDHYTRNHLYLPLGMKDTMFRPDAERRKRTATTQFFDGYWLKGVVNDTRARRMGGGTGNGGNFSTISDLTVFASVMLRQGEYTTPDGKTARLFSPETFRRMASSRATTAGMRAFGWDKRSEKPNRGALMSPRAIGHGGYTGISIWLDPEFDLFVIMLSTRLNINPSAPNIYPTAGKIADVAVDAIRDPHDETAIRASVAASVLPFSRKDDLQFLANRKFGLVYDSDACDSRQTPVLVRMLKSGVGPTTVFCRDERLPAKIAALCKKESLPVPRCVSLSKLNQRRILPPLVAGLDALVFDAVASGIGNDQTVADLGRAMQTAADNGLSFFVLDRPDPKGMNEVSGEFAEPGSEPSFAFRRLPASYAMSLGELALLFNGEYRMGMSRASAERPGALVVVPFREVAIAVPGTPAAPVVTQTVSLVGDMPWFKYQRGLYLIYPR